MYISNLGTVLLFLVIDINHKLLIRTSNSKDSHEFHADKTMKKSF